MGSTPRTSTCKVGYDGFSIGDEICNQLLEILKKYDNSYKRQFSVSVGV